MRNRLVSSGVAALAVLGFLTACTSGPAADVTASATKVTLASSGGDSFEVEKTSSAHVGDVVRTDSAGRAQLDYPDGSLTRLGHDTKLTVKELDSAAAQRTALTLDVGQTWHRVKKLVAEDAKYEVSTPVGVASVKGTAFEVDCTAARVCTVTVIEGVVSFKTKDGSTFEIRPYHRLVVPNPDGGDPKVTVAPEAVIAADQSIADNVKADKITVAIPVEAKSIAGQWTQTSVYTKVSSVFGTTAGRKVSVTWTIDEPRCAAECTFSIQSSSGARYAGTLTETGFTVKSQPRVTTCTDPATGLVRKGRYDQTNEVVVRRGTTPATESVFTGSGVAHYVPNNAPKDICRYEPRNIDETFTVTVTRR